MHIHEIFLFLASVEMCNLIQFVKCCYVMSTDIDDIGVCHKTVGSFASYQTYTRTSYIGTLSHIICTLLGSIDYFVEMHPSEFLKNYHKYK